MIIITSSHSLPRVNLYLSLLCHTTTLKMSQWVNFNNLFISTFGEKLRKTVIKLTVLLEIILLWEIRMFICGQTV